jgi:hypothetical protein
LVIDNADADLLPRIEAAGTRVLVTNAIMGDSADRARFAAEVLGFAGSFSLEQAATR